MMLFWLICAGLVAIALAFVLPTLFERAPSANENDKELANLEVYRDQLSELDADLANGLVSQEQYQQDRDEIERRLLEDVTQQSGATIEKKSQPLAAGRGAAYAVSLGIPVLAVSLYLLVGNRAALSGVPTQSVPASGAQSNEQMSQAQIDANVAALAKRLETNPNDADGWAMLGRSYINLEKYREASDAYAKAAALKTGNADLLVEYAFALGMANGRSLQGQPAELIKRALQIAPENPNALQLAGQAEFEAKNYRQAIVYWQKVLDKSSGNAELQQAISKQIDEAKSLAGTSVK